MKCLLKAASFASLFLTRVARQYLLTAVVGVPAFLHKGVFSVLKQISVQHSETHLLIVIILHFFG